MAKLEALLHLLEAQDNDLGLLTDAAMIERYRADATRRAGAAPLLVARPRSTEGVSAFLSACNRLGQAVVVQGGLTGLSGGARPEEGEVALSLERMTCIDAVDETAAMIVAEAGATLQSVQHAVASCGLQFGVDIGARGTATIGGMIATNAGGIRVLRYNMMRTQVIGLEAVLADGTVVGSMRGLTKDNSGPNLNQLFIGSEGLFGVVTKARLQLFPRPRHELNALCAVSSVEDALAMLRLLRQALGPQLSAFEGIFGSVYDGVAGFKGSAPLATGAPLYVLVEMQSFGDTEDGRVFERVLMDAYEQGLCSDIVVSQSGREFSAIWDVRENCTEYTFSLGRLRGHDVSVPLAALPIFISEAGQLLPKLDPDARAFIYGHLGDGNLHYTLMSDRCEQISPEIYRLAAELGGSVTAEHGVGVDKKPYLSLVRSAADLSTIRAMKTTLDPKNILNRGRVI